MAAVADMLGDMAIASAVMSSSQPGGNSKVAEEYMEYQMFMGKVIGGIMVAFILFFVLLSIFGTKTGPATTTTTAAAVSGAGTGTSSFTPKKAANPLMPKKAANPFTKLKATVANHITTRHKTITKAIAKVSGAQ